MQNYPTIMMHQLQKFEQEALDIYNQGTAKELQEIVARIVADIQGYSHGMNNIKCDINLKKIEKLVHSSISIGEHPINPK